MAQKRIREGEVLIVGKVIDLLIEEVSRGVIRLKPFSEALRTDKNIPIFHLYIQSNVSRLHAAQGILRAVVNDMDGIAAGLDSLMLIPARIPIPSGVG